MTPPDDGSASDTPMNPRVRTKDEMKQCASFVALRGVHVGSEGWAGQLGDYEQTRGTTPLLTFARRPSIVSSSIPVEFQQNSLVG